MIYDDCGGDGLMVANLTEMLSRKIYYLKNFNGKSKRVTKVTDDVKVE